MEGCGVRGRVVKPGRGTVVEMKHLQGEFSTGKRDRQRAGDPTRIELIAPQSDPGGGRESRLRGYRLVQGRVEYFDDLAGDRDRAGDIDDLLEQGSDARRQRGPAIAGRTDHQK